MKDLAVYELYSSDDRSLGLIADNLDYFKDHFNGKPLPGDWTPPKVTINGKRKRLRDFISWMLMAPVISQKAKDALEPLIAPYVQIFPFIELRKQPYYVINVTRVVDCLDIKKSELTESPDRPGHYIFVSKLVFDINQVPDAPIFRIPQWAGVYVRKPFVEAVITHGLKGAKFSDPGVSEVGAIMHGTLNVVPEVDDHI